LFHAGEIEMTETCADLAREIDALLAGEPDEVANMANAAAAVFHGLNDLNWAGFYRLVGRELVLGPFQGKPACVRIGLDGPGPLGVCATAAVERRTVRVADVHAFPGHIACDAASNAELVVPVFAGGELVAVLDLDSPTPGRFSEADEARCEAIAAAVGRRWRG
jgi:GAF domain-containing protein